MNETVMKSILKSVFSMMKIEPELVMSYLQEAQTIFLRYYKMQEEMLSRQQLLGVLFNSRMDQIHVQLIAIQATLARMEGSSVTLDDDQLLITYPPEGINTNA